MAQYQKNRANVSLYDDDADLLDRLKLSIESELGQTVPRAFIVRQALRELEKIKFPPAK
jgi:hypothetical protein